MRGYWETKEGQVLDITKMTDEHIQNCIDMINEHVNELNDLYSMGCDLLSSGQGEMATWGFTACLDRLYGQKTDFLFKLRELEEEKRRRNERE